MGTPRCASRRAYSCAAAGACTFSSVDAVLDDVQQGSHVFPDAGFQQRQDPLVATQLRDFPDEQVVNVGGYFRGARGERTGDL